MMANENYAQAAFQKMQLYNINGIMLSDTLLATYESEEAPLKSNIVENMIQQYFLWENQLPFYKSVSDA